MTKKIVWLVVSCLVVLSLLLASCAPVVTEEGEAIVPGEEVAPSEEEVVVTEEEEAPPAPAAFLLSNLAVLPVGVEPYEAVTISVSVANTGGMEGSYGVVLKINGVKEVEKNVTIAAGSSEIVIFSVTRTEPDSYSVVVDGLSASFTVVAPAPAKFVVTNLQAIPAPGSETSYRVSVDIKNTGDLKGVYQLRCKVDDEEMEPVEVELSPGERKTITLSEAEPTIADLAMKYKRGEIGQKQHVISVDGLSVTVTFKLGYMLQLLSFYGVSQSARHFTFVGDVKNISDVSLKDVEVVVNIYDADGKLVKSASALIEYNPISPSQTSPFRVKTSTDSRIKIVGASFNCSYYFRFLSGDIIPTEYE